MGVLLKAKARADLIAIRQWGEDHWGPAKTHDFLEGMIERIARLEANPRMGRARSAFHPDLRSIRFKGYAIFYCLENARPVIVAVLHERRNHAALDFADRLDEQ